MNTVALTSENTFKYWDDDEFREETHKCLRHLAKASWENIDLVDFTGQLLESFEP